MSDFLIVCVSGASSLARRDDDDWDALCDDEAMTGFLLGLQSYSRDALMMAVPMCESGMRCNPFFFATSAILLNLETCRCSFIIIAILSTLSKFHHLLSPLICL